MGDKVTPEMQKAYVEWDGPDMPAGNEVRMPRVLGLMRTAFFAGWIARAESPVPIHLRTVDCPECGKVFSRARIDHHLASAHNIR